LLHIRKKKKPAIQVAMNHQSVTCCNDIGDTSQWFCLCWSQNKKFSLLILVNFCNDW